MKKRTEKQMAGDVRRSERMKRAIADMVEHILIHVGAVEAIGDVRAHLDRMVMGNYVNNPVMVRIVECRIRKTISDPVVRERRHSIMEVINVWYGSGENPELSNLAERPFKGNDGKAYISVEHAYQTWKSGVFDPAIYNRPWKAGSKFVSSRKPKTDLGWNIRLMERIMSASFRQNPAAMKILMDTGDAVITHTQDPGIWNTEFPRILMNIREGRL